VQKPERSMARRERLKAFTEEVSNVTWQTIPDNLITRSEKKNRPGCITATSHK